MFNNTVSVLPNTFATFTFEIFIFYTFFVFTVEVFTFLLSFTTSTAFPPFAVSRMSITTFVIPTCSCLLIDFANFVGMCKTTLISIFAKAPIILSTYLPYFGNLGILLNLFYKIILKYLSISLFYSKCLDFLLNPSNTVRLGYNYLIDHFLCINDFLNVIIF